MASPKYPIHLGMRLGWKEMAEKVAKIYNALPPEERKVAGIYSQWYFPASAIDYYGPQYGLPHAVSGHLTYYLWGPEYSWDVMIMLMYNSNSLPLYFQECKLQGRIYNPYTIAINQPNVYVCRKPLLSPDEIWQHMETYQ